MENYWIVKSEPESYSWDDLASKSEEVWDGVRNFQARNFLRQMKIGDMVLFYHSGKAKEIVGIAEVSQAGFADPNDELWIAVKLKAKQPLNNPVTLGDIKEVNGLSELPMLRQSRLSVSPLSKIEFQLLLKMSL